MLINTQYIQQRITQGQGQKFADNGKFIAEALATIMVLKHTGIPGEDCIVHKDYKDRDGLKSPGPALAERSWKRMSRRRWIKKNKHNVKKMQMVKLDAKRRQEIREIKDKNKNKNKKAEKGIGREPLADVYDIHRMDQIIAEEDKWSLQDIADDDAVTMKFRSNRIKHEILQSKFGDYDAENCDDPKMENIAKDICNCFKKWIWIKFVFEAQMKHWICFYIQSGCFITYKLRYNKITIKHFNFVDLNGM